jgi:ribosomal protein S18 acetylase RimI-like enzyme
MRWMARLSPLTWWWSQADPGFQDSFNGFVWEEPSPSGRGKHIVGNVNLNRAPGSRRRYIICNVVVADSYRGQGIGRRLVERAIAEAHDLGATGVLLQVHQDNLPALRLYSTLGFQQAAGEVDLFLDAAESVAVLDAVGYQIRRWRLADAKEAHQLAQLSTASVQQWIRPLKGSDYQPGWWMRLWHWLADLVAGRRVYRLSVCNGGRLVGALTLTAMLRQGEHRLGLLLHPDHAGRVAATLVSRALHLLAALPPRPVRTTIGKQHETTLKALHDYGFVEGRTLMTLWKDFQESAQ